MTKETIGADAVIASVGGTTVQPSFVQKVGLWLAAGVGIVIASVTAGVVYFLISHHPDTPTLEMLKTFAPDTKQAIEQYKELSAVSVKSAQEIYSKQSSPKHYCQYLLRYLATYSRRVTTETPSPSPTFAFLGHKMVLFSYENGTF